MRGCKSRHGYQRSQCRAPARPIPAPAMVRFHRLRRHGRRRSTVRTTGYRRATPRPIWAGARWLSHPGRCRCDSGCLSVTCHRPKDGTRFCEDRWWRFDSSRWHLAGRGPCVTNWTLIHARSLPRPHLLRVSRAVLVALPSQCKPQPAFLPVYASPSGTSLVSKSRLQRSTRWRRALVLALSLGVVQ